MSWYYDRGMKNIDSSNVQLYLLRIWDFTADKLIVDGVDCGVGGHKLQQLARVYIIK